MLFDDLRTFVCSVQRDKRGLTSLHYAAVGGDDRIARALLSAAKHAPKTSMAAFVDGTSLRGVTSLHYAAAVGRKVSALVVRYGVECSKKKL